jgi:hypothetical protein
LNYFCLNPKLSLSRHWTVTIRSLLGCLTISRVIELRFKRDWSRWKAKTWGYKEWEPSSASKIVKIAHQQTFGLLLSNRYCLNIELLLSIYWNVTVQQLLSRHLYWIVQPLLYIGLLLSNSYCLEIELLLSRHWTVTVRPLLIFLTISRVIELCFKWDWSRWKVKTWGYKFSEGRRT